MYQQQPPQQGMQQYQQNQQNQQSQQSQHCHLADQDLANIVLAEMKRTAREYTTAILEANNPSVRENFYSLLDRTLQDQELVYTLLDQMNMYGQPPSASQKEIQKEEEQQRQRAIELQFFLQQNLGQRHTPLNDQGENDWSRQNQFDQSYAQFTQNQSNPYNWSNGQNQQFQPNQQYQQYQQNQQNQSNDLNQSNQQMNQQAQYQPQYPQSQEQSDRQQDTSKHRQVGFNQSDDNNPAKSDFSTPSTEMYQSAANTSNFNTT